MAGRLKNERWRQAPGYRDYDVSDRGRVRTWKSGKAKIMKTRRDSDGYIRVTLQDSNGQKRVERVHLLVARAFLGPANGKLVMHRDGKSWRPQLSNLKYGTYLENSNDKHRHKTDQVGERNSQAELIKSQVRQIYRLKGKYTQKDLAEMFGMSRQAISDIHRGITWAHITKATKK